MKSRKFKAQIVDNFKREWISAISKIENTSIPEVASAYGGKALNELAQRISGKVVVMLECKYGSDDFNPRNFDYFEEIDNDFVIPKNLFKEIK